MLYAVLHNPLYPAHHDQIFAYSDRRQRFVSMGHPHTNTSPLDNHTVRKLEEAASHIHSIVPAIASGGPTMLLYRVYGGDAELLGDCDDFTLNPLDDSYFEIIPNQGAQIHLHTHTSLMQTIASTVKFAAGVSFTFAGFTLNAPTALLLALSGATPFSDSMIERLFGQPVRLGGQTINGMHTDLRNALQDLHPVPEFFTAASIMMMIIGAAMLGFGGSWPVAILGCFLLAAPAAYSAAATTNNKYAIRCSIYNRVEDALSVAGIDPAALEVAGGDAGNAHAIPMAVVADPSPLIPLSRARSRVVTNALVVTAHDEDQLPQAERVPAERGNSAPVDLRRRLFPSIHDARQHVVRQALREIEEAQDEAARLGVRLEWPTSP